MIQIVIVALYVLPIACVDDDGLVLLQSRAMLAKENASATCTCSSPNSGTAGHNEYKCNGNKGYCASDQVCYAEGEFPEGDWGAGCAAPSCTCNTPSAGASGHNQYTCNDGTSAYCSSDQVCYATGSFAKGNWALGCQVTCNCNKDGVLHHVTDCNQCGQDLCGYTVNEDNVETFYSVGPSVPDWGCSNVGGSPKIVRNSVTGAIYVVEPVGQILMHVPTCSMCDRDFCDSSEWSKDSTPLNGYAGIETFTTADCGNVRSVVRDSNTGNIYAVKAAPHGSYRCTDGTTGSCPNGGGCPETGAWLKTDVADVGCPAPPNAPKAVTTTTTTEAAAADEATCANWCSNKKHKNQPWCGGKCSWQNCGACSECSAC
jgi:hypothetical protein